MARQAEATRRGLLAGIADGPDDATEKMTVLSLVRAWAETPQVMALSDTGAARSHISPQTAGTPQKEITPLKARMPFRWITGLLRASLYM